MLELYSDEERADVVFNAMLESSVVFDTFTLLKILAPIRSELDQLAEDYKRFLLQSHDGSSAREIFNKEGEYYKRFLLEANQIKKEWFLDTHVKLYTFSFSKNSSVRELFCRIFHDTFANEQEIIKFLNKLHLSTPTGFFSRLLVFFNFIKYINRESRFKENMILRAFKLVIKEKKNELKDYLLYADVKFTILTDFHHYFPQHFFRESELRLTDDNSETSARIKKFLSAQKKKDCNIVREYLEMVSEDIDQMNKAGDFIKLHIGMLQIIPAPLLRDSHKKESITSLMKKIIRNLEKPKEAFCSKNFLLFQELGIINLED